MENITPQYMFEHGYVERMHGCYICPVQCKRLVKLEGPHKVDSEYGGPEYETLAALGSNCLIGEVEPLILANQLCNDAGLDTISAGVSIAFAMECFELGMINLEDTGGVDLRFGNAEAMLEMLRQIIERRGLGELLGKGVRRASEVIGQGSEEFAVHVKGGELPMHDPRVKAGMGLHYAVHAGGPDHCTGIHDGLVLKSPAGWDTVDAAEPLSPYELSPAKARMLYQTGLWRQAGNYLGLCLFIPYSQKQVCEAVTAVTGFPMSHWRMMKTVERGMTLARIFNLREGFTREQDMLPPRFFSAPEEGPLKERAMDRESFLVAREAYYQMLGWDEQGVPTPGRMFELGIEWARGCLGPKEASR